MGELLRVWGAWRSFFERRKLQRDPSLSAQGGSLGMSILIGWSLSPPSNSSRCGFGKKRDARRAVRGESHMREAPAPFLSGESSREILRSPPRADSLGMTILIGWSLSPRDAAANSERRELLFLHVHILFASMHPGFGLLLAALFSLGASASARLTRGTSGRSFRFGLFGHCSAPLGCVVARE
jgi:hypothetical protein